MWASKKLEGKQRLCCGLDILKERFYRAAKHKNFGGPLDFDTYLQKIWGSQIFKKCKTSKFSKN